MTVAHIARVFPAGGYLTHAPVAGIRQAGGRGS